MLFVRASRRPFQRAVRSKQHTHRGERASAADVLPYDVPVAAIKTPHRHWRDYRTESGRRPIKEFLDDLTDEEVAAIVAGMKEVVALGLPAARHLRRAIYEAVRMRLSAASASCSLRKADTVTCCWRSPCSRSERRRRHQPRSAGRKPARGLARSRFHQAKGSGFRENAQKNWGAIARER